MKLYTTKVVAEYLDMTERNVRQLRDRGILKEVRPGMYDLKGSCRSYVNYIRKGSKEGVADYAEERARLLKAKRQQEEMELALKKQELHRTEDIEIVITTALIRFKTRLMGIPAKTSPILAKKTNQVEIFEIIKNATDEALEELSDFDQLIKEGEKNG